MGIEAGTGKTAPRVARLHFPPGAPAGRKADLREIGRNRPVPGGRPIAIAVPADATAALVANARRARPSNRCLRCK